MQCFVTKVDMETPGTCPVCFEDLKDKETASPDVCNHIFCLFCLQKWAKQGGNFCPVDRKRFRKIIDLSTSSSIPIKPRKRKKSRELYDVSVHCEVCSSQNDCDTLLLCDCCDLGYHCKCLTPPLKSIPPGIWNCPMCVAVGEKIRLKKGISKEVENIVIDNTNYWDSYSSDSSSSYDCLQERNNNGSALKNSSMKESNITENLTVMNLRGSSVSDMTDNSGSQRCLRKSRNLKYQKKELPKIQNLRPRKHIKYICSRSSSDSTTSVADSHEKRIRERNRSSSNTVCNIQIKLPARLKNGRFMKSGCGSGYNNSVCSTSDEDHVPRNHRKHKHSSESWLGRKAFKRWCSKSRSSSKEVGQDDSSCSNFSSNSSFTERRRRQFSNEKFRHYSNHSVKSDNSTQSKPLDLTTNENIDSVELAESTDINSEWDEIKNRSISDDIKKKLNPSEIMANSAEINSSQSVSPHQKASQLNAVDEKLQEKNPLSDDLLILNEITFSDNNSSLPNSSNHFSSSKSNDAIFNENPEMEMRVPSVSEELEDISVSAKTYSDINLPIIDSIEYSKTDNQIAKDSQENTPLKFSSQFSDVHHNFKDKLNCQNNFHDQKALSISQELKEIEREKWKTFHLRKDPKVSPRILCCSALNRNHACGTVEFDEYYQPSKYSDNYKRFLSITKSLRKKARYGEYDTVILPSLDIKKLVKKKYCHTPHINKLCSVSLISSPDTSGNLDSNNHEKHLSIPIKTEDLLHYKNTESELLCSVLCLPDVNKLSVRKDGSLFLDWHHS